MKGRITLALALVAGLAACGDDDRNSISGPDIGANCIVGSMTVGESRAITLGEGTGCRKPKYYVDDSSYTAALYVDLVAGQTYQFTADNDDDQPRGSLDVTLMLFGPGADTSETGFLTSSDDEGVGGGSNLIFVAPTTARYAIAVSGYDANDVGPVKLVSRSCGTLGVITTTGTLANGSLTPASCVDYLNRLVTADYDSSRVGAFQVQFAEGESKAITVTSNTDGYLPYIYMNGVGADTYDYVGQYGNRTREYNATGSVSMYFTAPVAGLYTVLVGNSAMTATSNFTVEVSNALAASAVHAPVSTRMLKAAK